MTMQRFRQPKYDICPACSKKGWYKEHRGIFIGCKRCRYCGSWQPVERLDTQQKKWVEYRGTLHRREKA